MGRGRGRWLSMSRAQGAGGRAQMVSLRQQTPAPRAMRPAPSDIYDIIILGGGTAGLVTASGCARLGRRVALIEKAKLGGDCLWTGCVPTKALVASAKLLHQMRHADAFGLEAAQPRVTPRAIMESMRARRREISRHDDPQKFRELGVDVIEGSARLVAANVVDVGGRQLTAKDVVLATGSRTPAPPRAPPPPTSSTSAAASSPRRTSSSPPARARPCRRSTGWPTISTTPPFST